MYVNLEIYPSKKGKPIAVSTSEKEHLTLHANVNKGVRIVLNNKNEVFIQYKDAFIYFIPERKSLLISEKIRKEYEIKTMKYMEK